MTLSKIRSIKLNYNFIFVFITVLFYSLCVFQRIAWGNPLLLHPDEPTVVESAFRMAESHALFPDVYSRPDYLEIILNLLISSVISPIIFKIGYVVAFPIHKFFFYRVGRCITMLFGAGTIILAFFIGKKINQKAGAICALLFAIFPLFMDNAYFATPDIPVTFMVCLTVLFAQRYLIKPSIINLVMMCLSASAAAAIKYPGIIGACIIAMVLIIKGCEDKNLLSVIKSGLLSAAVIILGLFVIAPGLFFRYEKVLTAFKTESRTSHLGADKLGFLGNMLFYAKLIFTSFGLLLTILFVIGLISVLVFKNKCAIPLAISPVYWIIMSAVSLHWERWSLPMMISPLILAGLGIVGLYEFILRHKYKRNVVNCAFAVILVFIVFSPVITDIAGTVNITIPDSRQRALNYCTQNQITPEETVDDGYTPFSTYDPRPLYMELDERNGKIFVPGDVKHQKKYVIVSSEMYDRYYNESKRFANTVMLYETLKSAEPRVATFTPVVRKTSIFTTVNIYDQIEFLKNINSSYCSGYTITIYRIV